VNEQKKMKPRGTGKEDPARRLGARKRDNSIAGNKARGSAPWFCKTKANDPKRCAGLREKGRVEFPGPQQRFIEARIKGEALKT